MQQKLVGSNFEMGAQGRGSYSREIWASWAVAEGGGGASEPPRHEGKGPCRAGIN